MEPRTPHLAVHSCNAPSAMSNTENTMTPTEPVLDVDGPMLNNITPSNSGPLPDMSSIIYQQQSLPPLLPAAPYVKLPTTPVSLAPAAAPRKRGRPKGSTNKNKRNRSGGLNIWDPKYNNIQPRLSTLELLALSMQQQPRPQEKPILPNGMQLLGPVSQTDVQVLLMLQQQEQERQERQQRQALLDKVQREVQEQLQKEQMDLQTKEDQLQREITRIGAVLGEIFQQQQTQQQSGAAQSSSVDRQILQLLQQSQQQQQQQTPEVAAQPASSTTEPSTVEQSFQSATPPAALTSTTTTASTIPTVVPIETTPSVEQVTMETGESTPVISNDTEQQQESTNQQPIIESTAASFSPTVIATTSAPASQTTLSDLEQLVSSLRVPEVVSSTGVAANTAQSLANILLNNRSPIGRGQSSSASFSPCYTNSTLASIQGDLDQGKKNRGRPRKYPEHMYQVGPNGKVKYPGARERMYFPSEEQHLAALQQQLPVGSATGGVMSNGLNKEGMMDFPVPAPKKRGRPKGSKNKSLVTSPQQLLNLHPVWNGVPEFRQQSQQLAAALTGLNYKLLRQSFPLSFINSLSPRMLGFSKEYYLRYPPSLKI
eukprot:sb/3463218/